MVCRCVRERGRLGVDDEGGEGGEGELRLRVHGDGAEVGEGPQGGLPRARARVRVAPKAAYPGRGLGLGWHPRRPTQGEG